MNLQTNDAYSLSRLEMMRGTYAVRPSALVTWSLSQGVQQTQPHTTSVFENRYVKTINLSRCQYMWNKHTPNEFIAMLHVRMSAGQAPHVVAYESWWLQQASEDDIQLCFTMRNMGPTLAQVRQAETISRATEVEWCISCAKALAELHGIGMVHRDIHERNIVRLEDGSVALIDLGCAWRVDDTQARLCTTACQTQLMNVVNNTSKEVPEAEQGSLYSYDSTSFGLVFLRLLFPAVFREWSLYKQTTGAFLHKDTLKKTMIRMYVTINQLYPKEGVTLAGVLMSCIAPPPYVARSGLSSHLKYLWQLSPMRAYTTFAPNLVMSSLVYLLLSCTTPSVPQVLVSLRPPSSLRTTL